MIDSYLFNLELNCLGFIYLLRIIVWSFCFFLVFLHSGMFGRRNTDIKHLPFQQNIPDTASRFLLHRREAIPATQTDRHYRHYPSETNITVHDRGQCSMVRAKAIYWMQTEGGCVGLEVSGVLTLEGHQWFHSSLLLLPSASSLFGPGVPLKWGITNPGVESSC